MGMMTFLMVAVLSLLPGIIFSVLIMKRFKPFSSLNDFVAKQTLGFLSWLVLIPIVSLGFAVVGIFGGGMGVCFLLVASFVGIYLVVKQLIRESGKSNKHN